MILSEQQFDECVLTPAQLKAAKKVYKAMLLAGKLGVVFWDNYGTLECYNGHSITKPASGLGMCYELSENPVTYSEDLNNFKCGNADDPLFFNTKI
jgi:hypothetical protein